MSETVMSCHHRSAIKPVLATALLLAAGLAGCSGDSNLMRDLAVASGVTGGEPKPAPDFVSRTRTTGMDYVPVGTSAPKRDARPKNAGEVTGAEAELDKARTQTQATGSQASAQGSSVPRR